MHRSWIRSTLFNIAFNTVTILCCVCFLPALMFPHKTVLHFVRLYAKIITLLEYGILNLRYEIRGQENLPDQGSYIAAMKHMSRYETFKLHILFEDPVIILKKELTHIPLFGQFLTKIGVIAIDRSAAGTARQSLVDGANRMKEQGRAIVIFPQGTRVNPETTTSQKPYKSGVYTMANQTGLTTVPIATNSGVFWPRTGWLKGSGTIVFSILPPIKTASKKDVYMKKLETFIEEETRNLIKETNYVPQRQKGK